MFLGGALEALLDLTHPQRCAWCGAEPWEREWTSAGPSVEGLRPWDRPHACLACLAAAASKPVAVRVLPGSGLEVRAAMLTEPAIVRVVGLWKYHGLRGLGWPLACLLARAADTSVAPVRRLVPVPLHARRRRERGFNQAAMLAGLAARIGGLEAAPDLIGRIRATGQQARLAGVQERRRNLAGAFRAGPRPGPPGRDGTVHLVDDVVTSGATVEAAAGALRDSGWTVGGVLCLAVAAGLDAPTGPVDIPQART